MYDSLVYIQRPWRHHGLLAWVRISSPQHMYCRFSISFLLGHLRLKCSHSSQSVKYNRYLLNQLHTILIPPVEDLLIKFESISGNFYGNSRYVRRYRSNLPSLVQPTAPLQLSGTPQASMSQAEVEKIHSLVLDLPSGEKREQVCTDLWYLIFLV